MVATATVRQDCPDECGACTSDEFGCGDDTFIIRKFREPRTVAAAPTIASAMFVPAALGALASVLGITVFLGRQHRQHGDAGERDFSHQLRVQAGEHDAESLLAHGGLTDASFSLILN